MPDSLPTAQARGGRGQAARSSGRAPRDKYRGIQEKREQRGSGEGVVLAPITRARKSNAVSDRCDPGKSGCGLPLKLVQNQKSCIKAFLTRFLSPRSAAKSPTLTLLAVSAFSAHSAQARRWGREPGNY